jgi:hypothetical protein
VLKHERTKRIGILPKIKYQILLNLLGAWRGLRL